MSSDKEFVPLSKCQYCSNTFSTKGNCRRHEMQCTKNPDRALITFECCKCHAKFSRKDNLSTHNCQGSSFVFMCNFCLQTFSLYSNAKRHVKICESNPKGRQQSFQCALCSTSFTRKDALARHSIKCNPDLPSKKKVMCLYENCDFQCSTKTILISHLKTVHDDAIKARQELCFRSESEFNTWKDAEEARTYSYFSRACGQIGQRMYFYCQHDGSDRAHRKAGTPARLTGRKNKMGRIKTGKVCISKMVVIINEDNSRHVLYDASHSHPLSKHDLAHQPPSAATNTFINNQLALSVPPREIHRKLQSTTTKREKQVFSRNSFITESRIKKRAARRKIGLGLMTLDPKLSAGELSECVASKPAFKI